MTYSSGLDKLNRFNNNQILDTVSKLFESKGFIIIAHCRLSHESDGDKVYFQGLTRAIYNQNEVMIKWGITLLESSIVSAVDMEIKNLTQVLIDLNKVKLEDNFNLNRKVNFTSVQNTENDHQNSPFGHPNLKCVVPLIKTFKSELLLKGGDGLNLSEANHPDHEKWQLTGFVMPYFNQGSIKDFLKSNPMNPYQKHQLIVSLSKAIANLHQAGWLHGDIKPSNVLIDGSQLNEVAKSPSSNKKSLTFKVSTYLSDLANALSFKSVSQNEATCQIDADTKCEVNATNPVSKNSLKKSAIDRFYTTPEVESKKYTPLKGTPAYLAPECWQGSQPSVQSDIYALGISIFEILSGEKPFKLTDVANSEKLEAWAVAHCQTEIPLLIEKLNDESANNFSTYQQFIDKLLAKKIENRYQNMTQVIQALEEVELNVK